MLCKSVLLKSSLEKIVERLSPGFILRLICLVLWLATFNSGSAGLAGSGASDLEMTGCAMFRVAGFGRMAGIGILSEVLLLVSVFLDVMSP